MKIALIGYGKMGQLIEKKSAQEGHEIVARLTSKDTIKDHPGVMKADVCIEFTEPQAAFKNIETLARMRKQIVTGTTGWGEYLSDVQSIVQQFGIGLVYGPNFSIGMQLLFKLIKQAAPLFKSFGYDIGIVEKHHSMKKDAPSGAALMLSELSDGTSSIASLRLGNIFGIHEWLADSESDTVTLSHMAKNRDGFAEGALKAADWIKDKQGCFNFSDILEVLHGKKN